MRSWSFSRPLLLRCVCHRPSSVEHALLTLLPLTAVSSQVEVRIGELNLYDVKQLMQGYALRGYQAPGMLSALIGKAAAWHEELAIDQVRNCPVKQTPRNASRIPQESEPLGLEEAGFHGTWQIEKHCQNATAVSPSPSPSFVTGLLFPAFE